MMRTKNRVEVLGKKQYMCVQYVHNSRTHYKIKQKNMPNYFENNNYEILIF